MLGALLYAATIAAIPPYGLSNREEPSHGDAPENAPENAPGLVGGLLENAGRHLIRGAVAQLAAPETQQAIAEAAVASGKGIVSHAIDSAADAAKGWLSAR